MKDHNPVANWVNSSQTLPQLEKCRNVLESSINHILSRCGVCLKFETSECPKNLDSRVVNQTPMESTPKCGDFRLSHKAVESTRVPEFRIYLDEVSHRIAEKSFKKQGLN